MRRGYGAAMIRLTPAPVRGALLAAVLALVVAGCGIGDGDSDEDKARDVIKDYATAVADGDEKEICGLLSEDSKRQLERGDATCEESFKNFGAFLNDEQKQQLKDIDPDVTVDGDNASAQVDEPPLEGEVRLKRENGDWKVTLR
jgi:hypothetical protein